MGMISANDFNPTEQKAGTVVATVSKPWYASKMVIFNGLILVGMTFVQILDALTGNNLLAPTIGLFVKDPAQATHLIEVLSQVYTLINMYLRVFKTNSPVSV